MGVHRGAQLPEPALALGLTQLGRLVEALLGLLGQRGQGLPQLQQLLFGLADQLHEHFALPPALATTAAHDLLPLRLEVKGWGLQRCGSGGALRHEGPHELEDFF